MRGTLITVLILALTFISVLIFWGGVNFSSTCFKGFTRMYPRLERDSVVREIRLETQYRGALRALYIIISFRKILPQMYLWTKKNWLYFESHPLLDSDLGIFEGCFSIARYGIFSRIDLAISLKKLIGSSRRFYDRCIFGRGILHSVFEVIGILCGGLRSASVLVVYFVLLR